LSKRTHVNTPPADATTCDLDALLEGDSFYQDPYPAYARLREESPVHWHAPSRTWLVSSWQDADMVLRAPREYSSYGFQNAYFERLRPELRAAAPTLELRGRAPTLITSDPPEHTRLRRLLQAGFTPKAIAGLRPGVEAIVDELLAAAVGERELDLVPLLAYPLPAMMIADLLGVPRRDRDLFKKVSSDVVTFMNRTNPNRELTVEFARYADRSLAAFRTYLRDLIDSRRLEPRDDVVSVLAHADFDGDRLGEEELLANLVLFLIAGHETTTGLLASAVYLLLANPEQLELVRTDASPLASAIQESLRFESPVQRLRRVVAEDVELAGVSIPAGEPAEVLIGSVNRDPKRFERPDSFDVTRTPVPSLAFGKGAHFCIGESLALLEADVALSTLFSRYPHLALAADWQPQWTRLTNLRCLSSLRVTADPC
jgi:pimeloyl-[acyl-carrier protein] synthase